MRPCAALLLCSVGALHACQPSANQHAALCQLVVSLTQPDESSPVHWYTNNHALLAGTTTWPNSYHTGLFTFTKRWTDVTQTWSHIAGQCRPRIVCIIVGTSLTLEADPAGWYIKPTTERIYQCIVSSYLSLWLSSIVSYMTGFLPANPYGSVGYVTGLTLPVLSVLWQACLEWTLTVRHHHDRERGLRYHDKSPSRHEETSGPQQHRDEESPQKQEAHLYPQTEM